MLSLTTWPSASDRRAGYVMNQRGVRDLVPTPVEPLGACICNNNTESDTKHTTQPRLYTHSHTHKCTLCCLCTSNASRAKAALKGCHHYSLQEAIMERKLIYSSAIPASFSPKAAYPLWLIGKIG